MRHLQIHHLSSTVQSELKIKESLWWVTFLDAILGYTDKNDMHNICNAIKYSCCPTTKTKAPMKSRDGTRLIKDNKRIPQRLAEHYIHFLNGGLTPDHSFLTNLQRRATKHSMECPPSITELEECVRKSPGGVGLPGKLFKYGGESILMKFHSLILAFWENEAVHKD